MALVHFLDGKQRGKTTTVDDARIFDEGRYRFKKREIAKTGGRAVESTRVVYDHRPT